MKKQMIALLFAMILFPSLMAVSLTVEKESSNEAMIAGVEQPAIFNLKITNNGGADNFQFYNLLGFSIAPKGTVPIGAGATKQVQLMIYPRDDFEYRGYYTFQYNIQGQDSTEQTEKLTMKIVNLEDAFEVGSGEVRPESNSMDIYIHNKENFNFDKMNVKFSSPFFKFEKEFALAPNQRKNFEVELNKEDFKKLIAGFYTLETEITVGEETAEVDGVIKFVEQNLVTTTTNDYGIIISTKVIKKVNQGNVVETSETVVKKNVLSRLFTFFEPAPTFAERKGLTIYYTWQKPVNPGETLEIKITTNWLFPFIIILLIVVIVALARQYSKTNLVLTKRVSFVKAKGGEFALKVTVFVNAKKYIERVNLIDRLPPMVKVYEKFGGEEPTRVDEKARRIDWNFEKLEAGEMRRISYILYSKIGVLGKFALPTATAIYERDGKIEESESNRAFFVTEPRSEKEE